MKLTALAEGVAAEISGFPAGDGDVLAQFKLVGATAPWNENGQARFGTMK